MRFDTVMKLVFSGPSRPRTRSEWVLVGVMLMATAGNVVLARLHGGWIEVVVHLVLALAFAKLAHLEWSKAEAGIFELPPMTLEQAESFKRVFNDALDQACRALGRMEVEEHEDRRA